MLGAIDQPLIVAISGMLLSFLEGTGYLSPMHHSENLQIVEALVGGLIAVVTIGSYFIHHTAVQNQKISAGLGENPSSNSFMQTLLNGLKNFIVSNSPKKLAPTTNISQETLQQPQN